MGNNQSFEQHQDFKDLQTNYTYEKKYNDSRFGEVKLLRENSTGQKVFQKDFSSNTPKEFGDYIEEIRDCSVLAHPNVLRVYGYNSKKEDLFCADFYKLSMFFESFESDLEQEIANRSHSKNYFPEKELWYILDSVASGCAFLQTNKIPHRDIRPFSVFITSSKDYKISATNLFRQAYNPGYFGHFDALEARSRYYSPELLAHFGTAESHRKPIDEFKSDVFSLGMTLLEAASLERDHSVYNFDKFQVNQDAIRHALERLKSRYSDNFVKTLQSTLDFNPETRLDFARLDRELGLYRRDIREQARGAGAAVSSPTKPDPTATHIRMGSPERHHYHDAPTYQSDELDQRVREAVRKSEEVIKRSSPTKYSNKNLDPYIQSYLRNDLHPHGQPILSQISPYLTSESKYTTTLTIEQPNYGRESQPINFGQPQASGVETGEHIKRSGFADPSLGLPNQSPSRQAPAIHSGTSFGQPAAQPTYSTSGYGQPVGTTYAHDYGTTAVGHHGQLGQSGAGTGAGYITGTHYGVNAPYGAGTTHVATANLTHSGHSGAGAGAGYGAHAVALGGSNLAHSGVGVTGYGTPGHAAYTHTSGAGDQSNRNYAGEADDLSRRIAERLQASKQLTH